MPLRTSFADACRTTRIRLDISQQALADAIGVSRGYIANVGLASEEVETAIRLQRDVIDVAFPSRAATMAAIARHESVDLRRGIALVDPSNRRADWLIRTRLDGRRSPTRYTGYADAVGRLGR